VTTEQDRTIEDATIAWYLRLRDADVETWEAFTVWLEADHKHRSAFTAVNDMMRSLDREVDEGLRAIGSSLSVAENDNKSRRLTTRWRWIGSSLVAAAAIVVIVATPSFHTESHFQIVTAPGEQRLIKLDGGTLVALNGATRMTLDHGNPRFAALETGEAAFIVRHDAAAPFLLEIGEVKVRDTGTIFNVIREPDGLTISVREGSVLYNPDGDAVPVKAGESLRAATGTSDIVVSQMRPDAVASWREGRLNYDMQPFASIARDLSRNLGVPVLVDPALSGRRFSGTIMIDRNRKRFFNRLGALLGVTMRQDGASWRMSAR
jgi:transmembrane sensor